MKVLHSDRTTKRKIRNQAKIKRFSDRVRLSVFRSTKHISAQLIDNEGKVIAAASDHKLTSSKGMTKTAKATEVGKEIAALALSKGIKEVVFDRGPYKYHGRVKAVAEAAREAKLKI